MTKKSQSALEKVILKAVGAGQQGVQHISSASTPKKEQKNSRSDYVPHAIGKWDTA